MAKSILIIGPSGSGKTYAGRNLEPKTTVYIVPELKELPFRGAAKNYKKIYKKDGVSLSLKSNFVPIDNMEEIKAHITAISNIEQLAHIKTVVIDTLTYAMLKSVMDNLEVDDWGKFTMFAKELKDLVDTAKSLRDDLTIIITAHEEAEESKSTSDTTPKRSFKIPAGRFTKEKIVPEGLFTVVLWTEVQDGGENNPTKYFFRTQSGKGTVAKSPPGMFEDVLIDNDLNKVISDFHHYYNDDQLPDKEDEKKSTEV